MTPDGALPVAVDAAVIRAWALPAPGGDKEARGRVMVVGGGAHTPGAVLLAGEAALRVGGGKLQILTAPETAAVLAVQVPEAGVRALPHPALTAHPGDYADALASVSAAAAVLVGPGVSDVDAAVGLVAEVVRLLGDDSGLVVDALGTAFLTERPDGLGEVASRTVVTVNPTELSRILDTTEDRLHDLAAATHEVARRTGAVVLCGGEGKHIAAPDGRRWRVDAGCRGLGISGSGDVQSGIVTGLLARGATPAQAAVWAAYLHGAAGESLAETVGPLGFLARELPGSLPRLLHRLGGA